METDLLRLALADDGASALPRVQAWLRNQVWAITPEMFGVLCEIVERRAFGGRLSAEEIEARVGTPSKPTTVHANGVAVIPVHGVIAHRMTALQDVSGGTSTTSIARDLRTALRDETVSAIVLDVDSPGGTVAGVQELAAELHEARTQKPVIAVANATAASAAYWLASQAHELVVTPSGQVGSIGVFAEHVDESKWEERLGFKTTVISAGKFKTEGHPSAPLEDEARVAMQAHVDAFYRTFTADVARGRGVPVSQVREGFGEGRMVLAKAAVEAGMADRVDTLEATIRRLQSSQGRAAAARAEDQWRLRTELALLALSD